MDKATLASKFTPEELDEMRAIIRDRYLDATKFSRDMGPVEYQANRLIQDALGQLLDAFDTRADVKTDYR